MKDQNKMRDRNEIALRFLSGEETSWDTANAINTIRRAGRELPGIMTPFGGKKRPVGTLSGLGSRIFQFGWTAEAAGTR
jgi:hypothetical protein